MSPLHAVILGIIQGLTEFLPVSSSAHLVLVPRLLGWPEHTMAFDIALHMGTLLALLAVFGRDLWGLAAVAVTRPTSDSGRFAWQVALATVPAAGLGLLLDDYIERVVRTQLLAMVGSLVALGILLWWADRSGAKRLGMHALSGWQVLLVGCAQALALFPGVSRSGVTMTAALLLGMRRDEAARLSFTLSFPVILGAGVLKLQDLTRADLNLSFWLGVVAAAITGYLVIRGLLDYLKCGNYLAFAIWRIALAVLVLGVMW